MLTHLLQSIMSGGDDEDSSFYVPSLHTTLTEPQVHNVRAMRRTLHAQDGAIYSRFCGSGKTLAMLTYLLSKGLSPERQALVAVPTSAMRAWLYNAQIHFGPSPSCILLNKRNKHRALAATLNQYAIVVVNFDTLIGAYEKACQQRLALLKQELERLDSQYPTWQNREDLSELGLVEYEQARDYRQQVCVYYREQKTAPTLHVPIPFAELERRATTCNSQYTLLLDVLFQRRWQWLVMDEAHEGRNRSGSLFRSLLAVNAAKRVAITATICSNGIGDFLSILDLIKQSPKGGWRALTANVSQCLAHLNEIKRRCVIYSPLEEDRAIERLYRPQSLLIYLPLANKEERARYRAPCDQYLAEAPTSRTRNTFALIPHLRQLAEGPTKTQAIITYLDRCVVPYNEKAVIFTWFVEYTEQLGEAIRTYFTRRNLLVEVVTGQTDQTKRTTSMVDRVARHRGPAVYVVTARIMGLGVDMQFANHALMTIPWWNPTVLEQAKRRIMRPRQRYAIRWVYFIMQGTVEECIDLVAYYKNRLNIRLLEHDIDARMLEQITSRRAVQRAQVSSGQLREWLGVPSSSSSSSSSTSSTVAEDDVMDEHLLSQSVLEGNNNGLLDLVAALEATEPSIATNDDDEASSSSHTNILLNEAHDLLQFYQRRFDRVMCDLADIHMDRAEEIDLSSHVAHQRSDAEERATLSSIHERTERFQQQAITQMVRKRKQEIEERNDRRRKAARPSPVGVAVSPSSSSSGTRQTMRLDLFGTSVQ